MRSRNDGWKKYELGVAEAMMQGSASVPMLLLANYGPMGLSEAETMFLIQLLAFREKEQNDYPSVEELTQRMSLSPDKVMACLQKLIKRGMLEIEQRIDAATGVHSEHYRLEPMYAAIAAFLANRQRDEERRRPVEAGREGKDLYAVFEREFARPLSPMECETIGAWLDQDGYSAEIVMAALKEAVFNGKIHFRYIDRILLEWSRNRVQTPQQAKEFSQRFRGGARSG